MVRALIFAALFALAGCQTVPKGNFCQIAHPIRLSQKAIDALSDAEVAKLLAFNRKGTALCHWKP